MSAITLEQLSAVCDEIAAIARAGLPLDRGLQNAAVDMPRRVGNVLQEMGTRLARGERLEALIAERSDVFPPAYRAVLEAGIRAGNLPAAVDAVSKSAGTLANLRHNIRLAWIYPYFILFTAYLCLGIMLQTFPVMWYFFREIKLPLHWLEQSIQWIANYQAHWYPALGLLLLVWIFWDWRTLSAQSALFERSWSLRLLGSGWRAGRTLSQQAAFCELLGLLVQHRVSLPQALLLAAAGSDPAGSSQALEATCQQLEQGNLHAIEQSPLPPLIQCVLLAGGSSDLLQQRLQRLADYLRNEADGKVKWAAIRLPVMIALLVGGLAVVGLACLFWVPWLRILLRLLEPSFT